MVLVALYMQRSSFAEIQESAPDSSRANAATGRLRRYEKPRESGAWVLSGSRCTSGCSCRWQLDQVSVRGIWQLVHRSSCRIDDQHANQATKDDVSPVPTVDFRIDNSDLILIAVLFIRDAVKLTIKETCPGFQCDLARSYAGADEHAGLIGNLVGSARGARLDGNWVGRFADDTCASVEKDSRCRHQKHFFHESIPCCVFLLTEHIKLPLSGLASVPTSWR